MSTRLGRAGLCGGREVGREGSESGAQAPHRLMCPRAPIATLQFCFFSDTQLESVKLRPT